uniref:E3 ubiquitin-protein ligase CHFR n=1 Tax=Hyaloperonospora arabidopsidis (strain Emoy2) TaxID=559515 RepID=M4BNM3_HYAAE
MLRDVALGSWEFSAAFCVGRSRGCEVSIVTSEDTRTVSKRHVGFVPLMETLATAAGSGKRRWVVHDLETLNGTAVNGEEVPTGGSRELRDRDEVVLASTMRQCVRLQVQFRDEARSHIIVKALVCSSTLSPAPLHRRLVTPGTVARRLPRRDVVAAASGAGTGLDRSVVTSAGSLAVVRTGCRSVGLLAGTVRSDANLMTPPPQSLSQKRTRTSPRHGAGESKSVDKSDKRRSTSQSQQRKRSRRGGVTDEEDEAALEGVAAMENDVVSAAKRAREHEKEERERLMMCSVCLEYYHGSATLPCSHTFCGYCISKWFRHSLSCPECRNVVKTVPVRNRALDELVERLVGHTEAYKSHVRRRARKQRRLVESRWYDGGGSGDNEDVAEDAVRGVGCLQLGGTRTREPRLRASIFTRWSADERRAFAAYINNQFGEARLATFKKVGLTPLAVDTSNTNQLVTAAQNLLLDCGNFLMTSNGCCQRLQIFLLFG